MSKATVVTFQWALNYGAILQTYGLQQTLQADVDIVEIANYAPAPYTAIYRPFGVRRPRALVKDVLQLPGRRDQQLRSQRFAQFIAAHLQLAPQRFVQRGLLAVPDSDYLFCGSDQIWNPDLTLGFDPVYFAAVATAPHCRKIAYAASAGRESFSPGEQQRLRCLLRNFDLISVRERTLADIVEQQGHQRPQVVLDPTLLLEAEQWRQIANQPGELAGKEQQAYVLLYSVAGYQQTRALAYRVAKERGLQVIEIANSGKSPKRLYPHATVAAAGPAEFVYLFDRAAFVVTDSFHGTAFALVFNKQFYCVPHRSRGSRMTDLLRAVDLLQRAISSTDVAAADLAAIGEINYCSANQRLQALRAQSQQFIARALEHEPQPAEQAPAAQKADLDADQVEQALRGCKQQCCGCALCAAVCPSEAISLAADEQGFAYPQVDASLCLACGLCLTACEFKRGNPAKDQGREIWACRIKDQNALRASTSGGMFTALSDYVLDKQGIVWGAAEQGADRICLQRAEQAADRDQMRGAKYVQSTMQGVFAAVAADLSAQRLTLFTGTPCQSAALRAYINSLPQAAELNRFLLVADLVCHGVPSPLLFADYIRYVESKRSSQVKRYLFRSKELGWRNSSGTLVYQDGKQEHGTPLAEVFNRVYFSGAGLRPSCYVCPYASLDRAADLTLGDFWGAEQHWQHADDDKGVSLVLAHTARGRDLLSAVADQLEMQPITAAQALQPNLLYPTNCPAERAHFWEQYHQAGAAAVFDHYAHRARLSSWLRPVKGLIRGQRNQ